MENKDVSRAWGRPEPVDKDPSRRPGVPMLTKPAVEGGTTGVVPQQEQKVPIFVGVEVFKLTPVFGTAVPPRGLSGLIRKAAYGIPEHKGGRWMLLMLGDRVDVWEGRILRHPFLTAGLVLGLGALLWGRPDVSSRKVRKAKARAKGRAADLFAAFT